MKRAAAILITGLINVERRNHDLLPVSYNWELDSVLRSHDVPPDWYYRPTNKSIVWNIENQTRHCNIEGCHYKPSVNGTEFNYMFRDTHKDSVPKIFRYRLKQRDCQKTDFVDGKKCSWWYAYYPVLLQNFTSFACVDLATQGTWTPIKLLDKQKRAFFCYFDTKVYYWP